MPRYVTTPPHNVHADEQRQARMAALSNQMRGLAPSLTRNRLYSEWLALSQQPTATASAAGGAGSAAGQGFSGGPNFYGFEDYDELEEMLFNRMSANVMDAIPPGAMSSSSMEYGLAAAAAEASMQRMNIERGELARRTQWEQDEAFRQFQQREAAARNWRNWTQGWAQIDLQQQRVNQNWNLAMSQQMQQWDQFRGSLSQQDYWGLMGSVADIMGDML